MQFRALSLGLGGAVSTFDDPAAAIEAIRSAQGLTWVDLEDPDEQGRDLLERDLHFHGLAVATCLDGHIDPPKVVPYEDHLFVLTHGVDHFTESELVEVTEIGIFIGRNYLVTCHRKPVDAVEHVMRAFAEDAQSDARRGADFLAHAVVSTLVGNIEPTVDRLAAVIEQIEEEIVDEPQRVHLDVLNRVKRSALRLARLLEPERVALRRISDRGAGVVDPECRYYFDDIADDVEFMANRVAAVGERANIAFSTYLSVVSIRQNEGVRVLSILAFVFLPLTLLAGVYGMNFKNMPELEWEYGYFMVLGIIAVALAAMTVWIAMTQRSFRRSTQQTLNRLFVVEPLRVSGYTAALARWPRRIANDLAATVTNEFGNDKRS
jgi:magnesium transporter